MHSRGRGDIATSVSVNLTAKHILAIIKKKSMKSLEISETFHITGI